jgi:hypothetical protein
MGYRYKARLDAIGINGPADKVRQMSITDTRQTFGVHICPGR